MLSRVLHELRFHRMAAQSLSTARLPIAKPIGRRRDVKHPRKGSSAKQNHASEDHIADQQLACLPSVSIEDAHPSDRLNLKSIEGATSWGCVVRFEIDRQRQADDAEEANLHQLDGFVPEIAD